MRLTTWSTVKHICLTSLTSRDLSNKSNDIWGISRVQVWFKSKKEIDASVALKPAILQIMGVTKYYALCFDMMVTHKPQPTTHNSPAVNKGIFHGFAVTSGQNAMSHGSSQFIRNAAEKNYRIRSNRCLGVILQIADASNKFVLQLSKS